MAGAGRREITIATCRDIARSVASAPGGRAATRIIRPPGLGLHRARPPLWLVLYAAAREGRLLVDASDNAVVLEPPVARRDEWASGPNGSSALGFVVRHWDHLVFAVPPVSVLLASVPLAFASRIGAAIALMVIPVVLAYVVLGQTVGVAKLGYETALVLSGSGRRGEGPMGEELLGYHWTISLCHIADPERVGAFLRESVDRAAELTAAALPPDPAFGTVVVALRAACVTFPESRRQLAGLPGLDRVAEDDWFVAKPARAVERPTTEAVKPLGGIPLMLVSMAACLAAGAAVIASLERTACAATGCDGRPATYSRALVWLLHFVAQQPTGPATWMSRSIGALTTVALVTTALCLAVVLRQRARYRRARGKLVYRALGDGSRSTVLILVVNDIERNAVIAAAGGPDPVVDQFGTHAIYRLGRVGSTDVVLAQSQQGTVDAGAMTLTSEALLRRLRPGAAILTGICYGLKSRELDGGDQEIGDVVVSTQLRGMDHKKVTERPGGVRREINRGERVSPSPRLLSSARALAWNWPRPAVHTGPVVSLNTLVDSAAERRRIKIAEEEAVAGEMELAGLHAAATLTKTDWILVKGISDWGVGKSDGDQKRAARNAADFVVALIARIVPAGPDDA